VPARDLPILAAFYGEMLGLPRSVYMPGRNDAGFEPGNLTVSIYDPEAMGFEHRPNGNAIALHVDDVAARPSTHPSSGLPERR
jgi:hypothetical protein